MKTWFKAYRPDGSLEIQVWTASLGTEAAERAAFQAILDRGDLACVEIFHEEPLSLSEKLMPCLAATSNSPDP